MKTMTIRTTSHSNEWCTWNLFHFGADEPRFLSEAWCHLRDAYLYTSEEADAALRLAVVMGEVTIV
jgi:hypothetical protein